MPSAVAWAAASRPTCRSSSHGDLPPSARSMIRSRSALRRRQVGGMAGDVGQVLEDGPRPGGRRSEPVSSWNGLGHPRADDVPAVGQPDQVALVAQRPNQVIRRRHVQLAAAGDDLHRQRARRPGHLLDDPQGAGHAADQVGRARHQLTGVRSPFRMPLPAAAPGTGPAAPAAGRCSACEISGGTWPSAARADDGRMPERTAVGAGRAQRRVRPVLPREGHLGRGHGPGALGAGERRPRPGRAAADLRLVPVRGARAHRGRRTGSRRSPGSTSAEVEIVWDEAWTTDRLSARPRSVLRFLPPPAQVARPDAYLAAHQPAKVTSHDR